MLLADSEIFCEREKILFGKVQTDETHATSGIVALSRGVAGRAVFHDFAQQELIVSLDFANALVGECQARPRAVLVAKNKLA